MKCSIQMKSKVNVLRNHSPLVPVIPYKANMNTRILLPPKEIKKISIKHPKKEKSWLSYYHNFEPSINYRTTAWYNRNHLQTIHHKMCCLINTCVYVFCKNIQTNSVITKLSHSYTEIYARMSHVTLMEISLRPCRKISTYWHLNTWSSFISILKRFKQVWCWHDNLLPQKGWRQQYYIFRWDLNISYLKAHFKTTTNMVSINCNMNFICDEWISDKHIASKVKEKLSK